MQSHIVRRLFVCLLLGLLIVGVFSPLIQNAYSTTLFSNGFEEGKINPASTWTSNYTSGSSTIAVTTEFPYAGSYSAKSTLNALYTGSYARLDISGQPITYTRGYYNFSAVPTTPTQHLPFSELWYSSYQNSIAASISYNSTSAHAVWELFDYVSGAQHHFYNFTATPVINTWYSIEILRDVTNGRSKLWIDGVLTLNVTEAHVGNTNIVTHGVVYTYYQPATVYYDTVEVATSYIGVAGNAPTYSSPTVNATKAGGKTIFSLYWTAVSGTLSKHKFAYKNGSSGSWYNETWQSFTPGQTVAWYNTTHTIGQPYGIMIYWQESANNTDGITTMSTVQSFPTSPATTNWLSGWGYRKAHVINNATGAGTDYPINLTIYYGSGTDTAWKLYLGNLGLKSDFSDISITASDGTTTLNQWRVTYQSNSYSIWYVRVSQDISINYALIYVYYGNQYTSLRSNIKSVFPLLADDFRTDSSLNSTIWTSWGSPTLTFSSTTGINITSPSGSRGFRSTNSFDFTNKLQVIYSWTTTTSNSYGGDLTLSNTITTPTYTNQQRLREVMDSDNPYKPVFQKIIGGSMTVLYTFNGFTQPTFLNNTLVTNGGSFILCEQNNTQVYKSTSAGLLMGVNNYVMLESFANSGTTTFLFQYVAVAKYVDPEPIQGDWGTQETESTSSLHSLTVNSNIPISFSMNTTAPTGYVVYAASGEIADLQAAIDNVHSHGDNGTVVIPSGTFTFNPNDASKTITYGGYYGVKSYGGINLLGVENQTILKETAAGQTFLSTHVNTRMLFVDGTNGKPFRISGISFYGYVWEHYGGSGDGNIGIEIRGATNYRIDHSNFANFSNVAIFASRGYAGANRGLVDHVKITNPYKDLGAPEGYLWGYGLQVFDYDPSAWSNINTLLGQYDGTIDVMYAENCFINNTRHATSVSANGYIVVRYSTLWYGNGVNGGYGITDIHGFNKGRGAEAYNNTYVGLTITSNDIAVELRGGENTVFNNTYVNMGTGNLFMVESPGNTAQTRVTNTYVWGNSMSTGNLYGFQVGGGLINYTQNIDYFLYARPNYTPYTYPHYLQTSSEIAQYPTNMTVPNLSVNHYAITISTYATYGGSTYEFSQWEDASTNTTRTIYLSANTTITATYTLLSTPASLSISLSSPTNGAIQTYRTVAFIYIPTTNTFFTSASLWTNASGTWGNTVNNATTVQNATSNTITYTFNLTVKIIWNIKIFNGTTGIFASANRTLTIKLFYQMTFLHRDVDLNVVDSIITWTLWNASQQLTYTEGTYALLTGNYTLETRFHGRLIHTITLSTATYGNTTITINLSMRALTSVSGGYAVFNRTLSSLAKPSDTITNITLVPTGSGATMLILDVNKNASYVQNDGVNQTWAYISTYIVYNFSMSSSVLEFIFTYTYPVAITIISPTNSTYNSGTVTVTFSVSTNGTLSLRWFNFKNGSSWVYLSNQTYTGSIAKSGFLNGSYVFVAWANNTEGYSDREQVVFTVSITTSDADLERIRQSIFQILPLFGVLMLALVVGLFVGKRDPVLAIGLIMSLFIGGVVALVIGGWFG